MSSNDIIIPIVVAIIGLLGSAVSLIFAWINQTRAEKMSASMKQVEQDMALYMKDYEHKMNIQLKEVEKKLDRGQVVSDLTEKYGQPLLVAAYDLQQRLFDLVEYPISRQAVSNKEGLEDFKIFTSFLLAQYLVYSYILRTKVGYLSFSDDPKLQRLRKMMYVIDEELDRRRDAGGRNVGVWPAGRVLTSERMIDKDADVNGALDGGLGCKVKGFNKFKSEWETHFQEPMGYFCTWLDLNLEGRKEKDSGWDAPMRCLQHLLVDLVQCLDKEKVYVTKSADDMKCKKSSIYCDCSSTECFGPKNLERSLKHRQDSRWNDVGLWSVGGLQSASGWRNQGYDTNSDNQITLDKVKQMTYTVNLL